MCDIYVDGYVYYVIVYNILVMYGDNCLVFIRVCYTIHSICTGLAAEIEAGHVSLGQGWDKKKVGEFFRSKFDW